uniref:Uncharacterized protein n=1 Tax=Nelumbo nucifera TaxID=4432 RepID=A0A822XSX2_NELNU|nr:TPA_asm: hypothetical protein HUJ06_023652 [Nelumbo nucifera]
MNSAGRSDVLASSLDSLGSKPCWQMASSPVILDWCRLSHTQSICSCWFLSRIGSRARSDEVASSFLQQEILTSTGVCRSKQANVLTPIFDNSGEENEKKMERTK